MMLSELIEQLQNEYNKHGDMTVIKASDAEGNDFDTVCSIDMATYSEDENSGHKCIVIW